MRRSAGVLAEQHRSSIRSNHAVRKTWQDRNECLAHLSWMHELWRKEMARLGARDGRGARAFQRGAQVGNQFLRYRERLLGRGERGDHRAMARRDGEAR